jgi:glycosyltransferase involved in cell wall biosynthesis
LPKIAFINTVCTGSHGRLITDLRKAAEKHKFDTKVAFGRGRATPDDMRIGSKVDVLSHVAITRIFDAHGAGSRRATSAFLGALSEFGPDIIHLHNAHGYYLHLETLFSYIRQRRINTLWTLHDCWAFTGHCSHFIRAGCERYQSGCHDCPLKKEYPASLLFDASKKNWQNKKKILQGIETLKIICPSAWLDHIVGQSFLKDIPRTVISNGVDLSLFVPKRDASLRGRFGIPQEQIMLLAVASPFDRRKGYDDLIELARHLSGKASLVMVGLSKKQMRRLPSNIHGMLKTDGPEDLVRLYGEADCFLNASHEETYPTVNMEALACGTPVAAYDIGGCTEQVTPEVGLLAPCGDIGALKDAALRLAHDKKSMSAACSARAEQFFDREKAISAYISEYTQMERV